MADNTRDQDLPGGEFHVAPNFEFMFVTDVAGFDQVRLGVDTEHDVDDVAQRKIGGVRTMPAAPADVIAHSIDRDPFEGMIQNFKPYTKATLVEPMTSRRNWALLGIRLARAKPQYAVASAFSTKMSSPSQILSTLRFACQRAMSSSRRRQSATEQLPLCQSRYREGCLNQRSAAQRPADPWPSGS